MPDQLEQRDALERGWTHAHEEDHDGRLVFRPSDRDFAPARGRSSFTLAPGGSLAAEGPGPDDRPVDTQGTWEFDGEHLDLLRFGSAPEHFIVEEVSDDLLVVRPDHSR